MSQESDFDGDHEWASEWEIVERDFHEVLSALPTAEEPDYPGLEKPEEESR